VYGDPLPWSVQPRASLTLVSFLNLNKYPPSLLFLLMALGPVLLILRALDGRTPILLRPAQIVGKVPFFYYLMHVLLLHVIAAGAMLVRFGSIGPAMASPTLDRFPMTQPPGWPASLPVVYVVWIMVVLVLFPFCAWYAGVKRRSSSPWLSYL
jgi:hypothetical protein